jgi:hypothetical protein
VDLHGEVVLKMADITPEVRNHQTPNALPSPGRSKLVGGIIHTVNMGGCKRN